MFLRSANGSTSRTIVPTCLRKFWQMKVFASRSTVWTVPKCLVTSKRSKLVPQLRTCPIKLSIRFIRHLELHPIYRRFSVSRKYVGSIPTNTLQTKSSLISPPQTQDRLVASKWRWNYSRKTPTTCVVKALQDFELSSIRPSKCHSRQSISSTCPCCSMYRLRWSPI